MLECLIVQFEILVQSSNFEPNRTKGLVRLCSRIEQFDSLVTEIHDKHKIFSMWYRTGIIDTRHVDRRL